VIMLVVADASACGSSGPCHDSGHAFALFQSLGSVVYVARVPFVSAKVKVLENVSLCA